MKRNLFLGLTLCMASCLLTTSCSKEDDNETEKPKTEKPTEKPTDKTDDKTGGNDNNQPEVKLPEGTVIVDDKGNVTGAKEFSASEGKNGISFMVDHIKYEIGWGGNELDVAGWQGVDKGSSITIYPAIKYKNKVYYTKKITNLQDCPAANISIPFGVNSIEKYAMKKAKFEELLLPSSIGYIDEHFHSGMMNLKKIAFKNPNITFTEGMFAGFNLESIEFPANLRIIPKECFRGCYVKTVDLPKNLNEIEEYAFDNSKLESIELPNSVGKIGTYSFGFCENLKSIKLSKSLKVITSKAFYYCKKLERLEIPAGVTTIEEEAFSTCFNLKELTIPNTLKKIDRNGCFRDSQVLSKVKFLGTKAEFKQLIKTTFPNKSEEVGYHLLISSSAGTVTCTDGTLTYQYHDPFK